MAGTAAAAAACKRQVMAVQRRAGEGLLHPTTPLVEMADLRSSQVPGGLHELRRDWPENTW